MSKAFQKLQSKTAGVAEKANSANVATKETNVAAPFLIGQASERLHSAEARVVELNALLDSGKTVLNIPLDELYEIPGRKRNLDPENYEILKNNLAKNELITPIICRRRSDGGYEIISGHNRTHVFRELGRLSIPAIVADISDQDAQKDAFFANLIHSSLPDYEKFIGIQNFINENPGTSLEKIAEQIGISKGHISKILTFNSLPKEAHDLLKTSPGAVGANASLELAALAEKGHSELVITAIELITKNELDQTKAKDWIQKAIASQSKKPEKVEIKPIVIKQGKAAFCNLRRAQKVIRLEFQSANQAEALEKDLHEFLKTLAKGE